jgi:hypothetical protein
MTNLNTLSAAAGVAGSVLSDVSGGSPALSLSLSALSYAGNPAVSEFSSILGGLSASLGLTGSSENALNTVANSLFPADNAGAGQNSGGLSAVNSGNSLEDGVNGNSSDSLNYAMLYAGGSFGINGALYPGINSPGEAQVQQLSAVSAANGVGNAALSVSEGSAQPHNQSGLASSASESNNSSEKKSSQNINALSSNNVFNTTQNGGNFSINPSAAANGDFNHGGYTGSTDGTKSERKTTKDLANHVDNSQKKHSNAGTDSADSGSLSVEAKKKAGMNNNGSDNNNSSVNTNSAGKSANNANKISNPDNYSVGADPSINNNPAKAKNIVDIGKNSGSAVNGKTEGKAVKKNLSPYDLSVLNNESGKKAINNLIDNSNTNTSYSAKNAHSSIVVNRSIDNTFQNQAHGNKNNININAKNNNNESNSSSNLAVLNKNAKDAYAAFEKVIGNGNNGGNSVNAAQRVGNGANSSDKPQQMQQSAQLGKSSKELSILAADYLNSGTSESDNLISSGSKSEKLTFSDANEAGLNNTLNDGLFRFSGSLNGGSAARNESGAGAGSNFSNEFSASLNNDINNDGSGGSSPVSLTASTLSVMLKKNMQSAVITLKPASLGSIKINLSITGAEGGGGTNNLNKLIAVNILTQTDEAKNMLQSSSSNLTDALKNQGFTSINLNISSGFNNGDGNGAQSFADNAANNRKNYASSSNRGYAKADGGSLSGGTIDGGGVSPLRRGNSVIDYFV